MFHNVSNFAPFKKPLLQIFQFHLVSLSLSLPLIIKVTKGSLFRKVHHS